jgi:hypothetical protein
MFLKILPDVFALAPFDVSFFLIDELSLLLPVLTQVLEVSYSFFLRYQHA